MNSGQYIAELQGALFLDRFGQWFHEGKAFTNQKLSDLFSRSVTWDSESKRFLICIGIHKATFSYEDTPYFALTLDDRSPEWQITFSDGSHEVFDPTKLCIGKESQFYYSRQDSQRARCSKTLHQVLVQFVVSNEEIEMKGKRYRISKVT